MRRSMFPLVLVVTGVGLIVVYLLLNFGSNAQAPEGPATGSATLLASQTTRHPTISSLTPSHQDTITTDSVENIASPTQTAQPIYPTPTPHLLESLSSIAIEPTSTVPVATLTNLTEVMPCPLVDCLDRVGVSGRKELVNPAYEQGLPFGHYLNWRAEADPPLPGDAEFWQMVAVNAGGPALSWEELGETVDARPGSIWIVGNEPDIIWQNNIPAERYAQIYHDVYTFIKHRDPDAKLAIAGVGQPTPLRLAYLDIVLDTYFETYGEPLPIDIWTIHAFVLREQRDSWGVGIPPGMADEQGELYELADHDDLAHFQNNLINFRLWMADRGYREWPLAVTEFGILHPAEYGFPPEVVADFMIGAFEFFASAANESGYPDDENRLVQWWFWYSVYDDGDFPTGNLFDPENGQLTPLGQVFISLAGDK